MTVYFKQVTISNLDIIQQKVLNILNREINSHSHTHVYYPDNDREYLEIPELVEELKKLGFDQHIFSTGIFVVAPGMPAPIHHDVGYKYSFNLPIQGCENTEVNFFNSTKPPEERRTVDSGKRFYYYDPAYCTQTASCNMSSPYILNTSEPHNIVNLNPAGSKLRITLLLRLNEELGDLF